MLTAKQSENLQHKSERRKRKGKSTAGLEARYEKVSECNKIKADRKTRKKLSTLHV